MRDVDRTPTLVFLIGPPAVGKMTVGQELARLTGFPLFHHHQLIDFLTAYFAFDSPPFSRLFASYRAQFFAEAANCGLSLVTTAAGIFDDPQGRESWWRSVQPYTEDGRRLCFARLIAPLGVIFARNHTENRRRHKKTEWSTDEALRESVAAHDWQDSAGFPFAVPYLRLDTEHLSAAETALRISGHFGLPRQA